MSDTPGSPASVPVLLVDAPESPFMQWPLTGASARVLWDELIALVSGTRGCTLRSAMLVQNGKLERENLRVAVRHRYDSVIELLGELAAALIASGEEKRIARLDGQDITGRGEAIAMLRLACGVRRTSPKLLQSDEKLRQSVDVVMKCRPAIVALATLRDEVLTPVGEAGSLAGTETQTDHNPPEWTEMKPSMQAILTALNSASARLNGSAVAKKAGYKNGTLRHHYGDLRHWGFIDKTKDGYAITPAGRALVPV
jgi:hypothetical protein